MTVARNLLLALGLAALTLGLWWHPPDAVALLPSVKESLQLAGVAGLFAVVLAWRLRLPAAAIAWGLCVPAVGLVFAGIAAAAATALLLLAAAAIGTLLPRVEGTTPLLRILAGLGLLAGVAGWLLPFPVHHAATWGLAMAGLVAWRHRAIREDFRAMATEASDAFAGAPRAAFFTGLLAVVATAPAWLPVRMADDVAYHLGLGWELMSFGHARFDVGSQVWALAPWSTDVLHALVMVLAEQETIGFLNAFWLLATAWLVRGLGASLGLAPRWCWLASAAYLTLPMTHMLAGSLQVESATPAWFAALATLLVARVAPGRPALFLVAVLAGSLIGAKVSNGLLLLPFCVWWLLQWRGRLPWRDLPFAVALGLLAAGSSYAYAAWLTGNPVAPLANGVFESPWFMPGNFHDTQWTRALGWDLPWRWILDPGQFHEGGRAGAAGVMLLPLFGGLLLALAEPRWRALGIATLVSCLLLLSQIQYLRYLQPLMPMLLVLMMAGFSGRMSTWRQSAVAALVAVQFVLLPTASWILMDHRLRLMAGQGERTSLLRIVPERLLADHFRSIAAPGDFVLFAQSSNTAIAELPRRSAANSWHSISVWKHRQHSANWPAMFEATGATHVISRDPANERGLAEALAEREAVVVMTIGPSTLYRLKARPVPVDTSGSTPDQILARLPMDPAHPVTGWMQVDLGCDRPGELVFLSWELDRPIRGPLRRRDEMVCGADKQMSWRIYYESLAVDGSLRLAINSAAAESEMTMTVMRASADRRRNPSAETERYHVVWDALCARPGCGRQRSRLLTHALDQDRGG